MQYPLGVSSVFLPVTDCTRDFERDSQLQPATRQGEGTMDRLRFSLLGFFSEVLPFSQDESQDSPQ